MRAPTMSLMSFHGSGYMGEPSSRTFRAFAFSDGHVFTRTSTLSKFTPASRMSSCSAPRNVAAMSSCARTQAK